MEFVQRETRRQRNSRHFDESLSYRCCGETRRQAYRQVCDARILWNIQIRHSQVFVSLQDRPTQNMKTQTCLHIFSELLGSFHLPSIRGLALHFIHTRAHEWHIWLQSSLDASTRRVFLAMCHWLVGRCPSHDLASRVLPSISFTFRRCRIPSTQQCLINAARFMIVPPSSTCQCAQSASTEETLIQCVMINLALSPLIKSTSRRVLRTACPYGGNSV